MIDIKIKKIVLILIIFISAILYVATNKGNSVGTEIKIVSYNIHSGVDKDMFPTLFDTVDFLKQTNADIICLQEVNESAKVGFQVSSLKEELGMYSHFGANVVSSNSNYGLVTYSKYKIIKQKHVYLSSIKEQRGFLNTIIDIKGKKVNIINVHLGVKKDEQVKQIKELQEFIRSLGNETYIICGDFNCCDVDFGQNTIDIAKRLDKSNTLTFSSDLERIDYIFASKDVEVKDYNVLIKKLSDHYPIVAKVKI